MSDRDVNDKPSQWSGGHTPQKYNLWKVYATTVDHHYAVIGKQNWAIYQVHAYQISISDFMKVKYE